jgi:hypothetical protein
MNRKRSELSLPISVQLNLYLQVFVERVQMGVSALHLSYLALHLHYLHLYYSSLLISTCVVPTLFELFCHTDTPPILTKVDAE